jgi:hypothetical protein
MKKTCLQAGFTLLAGVMAIISLVQLSDQAQARPQYFKAFAAKYPDFKVDADSKCAVCHKPPDKKSRNDYGAAVGKALGAKNVKDPDTINAALDKAAAESAGDGKTFGDLIKAGTLPITK